MNLLAEKIDNVLNDILLKAENQHEFLVGTCQSEVALTNTQEHILMLVAERSMTNTELARTLHVSQAAVTKAVKHLIAKNLLVPVRDKQDARVVRYVLTDAAQPIAEEHRHHHVHTLETYEALLTGYSSEEQATIGRFLDELMGRLS